MKVTHIANATCVYEHSNGFKLLADPWLTDGAFHGSWYHYPPLVTKPDFFKDINALYISHLHDDHCDETVLKTFPTNIPVYILDRGRNFLQKKLLSLGFKNIIKTADFQQVDCGPFVLTFYGPFANHPFDLSLLGNFLDSAIVIQADGEKIFNANDNTPTETAAQMLHNRHGSFSLVQLKCGAAGPYPQCFDFPSEEAMLSETSRIIQRQILSMCKVAKIMHAAWMQPFAGDYTLGGRLVRKNQYIAVPGDKYSAEFIAGQGLRPLILSEQSSFDLSRNEVKSAFRQHVTPYDSFYRRVAEVLYDYERDPQPDINDIKDLLLRARKKLFKAQEDHKFFPKYKVRINFFNEHYILDLSEEQAIFPVPDLTVDMDERLLCRILKKEAHWNTAEVGSHMNFKRKGPYNVDVHNMLSFFHI